MKRKRHSPEQIIAKLREAEAGTQGDVGEPRFKLEQTVDQPQHGARDFRPRRLGLDELAAGMRPATGRSAASIDNWSSRWANSSKS